MWRVSSGAFSAGTDGTASVDLEQLLLADGKTALSNFPGVDRAVALVAHQVGHLQASGLSVAHVPVCGNYYHAEVSGLKPRHKKSLHKTMTELVPVNQELAQAYHESYLA